MVNLIRLFFALILFSNTAFAAYSDSVDILQNGNVVSSSNPLGVRLTDGTSFLSNLPVSQSGAWGVSLLTGSNVIGSISNSSFGISGTLPAFAATPTFNVGTGAFVDRTTAAAPYAQRLSDGTAFYDARAIRALTSSDVVTIANPTTSVSVSNFPATQPISAASLPLPTGAATSALQTTGNTSLNSIDTKTPALGQTTMAGSTPVAIASNQSAIPISAASLPLPTGAATESTLSTLNSKIPNALTVNGSMLWVDGSNAVQPISASSLPLPTGASSLVEQQAQTTLLNTIASNTGAQATDTIAGATITALNGAVAINAQGAYTVSALITGTWVGTLVAEGRMADGTTWVQLPMNVIQTVVPYPTTFTMTTNASVLITGGGYTQIRIRALAFTSGTVNVFLNASLAQQTIFASQLGSWTVNNLPVPNTLGVTAVGTANNVVTLTMPAVAGQFHLIDSIEITLYSTAARTGSATPITCTTTNLSGNPSYTWATAAAIGSADTRQLNNANRPIRSSAVNTATTIVCPAVNNGLWRMNATYSTNP